MRCDTHPVCDHAFWFSARPPQHAHEGAKARWMCWPPAPTMTWISGGGNVCDAWGVPASAASEDDTDAANRRCDGDVPSRGVPLPLLPRSDLAVDDPTVARFAVSLPTWLSATAPPAPLPPAPAVAPPSSASSPSLSLLESSSSRRDDDAAAAVAASAAAARLAASAASCAVRRRCRAAAIALRGCGGASAAACGVSAPAEGGGDASDAEAGGVTGDEEREGVGRGEKGQPE